MAIRLIATDMDDTLLGSDGCVSERTKAALSEAMRRGVYIVLASGRMPQAMQKTAQELHVNAPVIGFNGALTVDLASGQVFESLPVPQEMAREAAAFAESLGAHVQAYQNGSYYYETENSYSRAYGDSIRIYGHAVSQRISQWFEGGADKLLVIGEREQIPVWEKKMQAHFGERLRCEISRPNYIEVFRTGVDKSAALRTLAERIGISREETAAFGDGGNDLGMVLWAGHGYIMANARESVQAQAPAIAPSNAQDGLARTVEKWLSDGTIPKKD